jgi:DNA invertase Pin-like site-specific DNA recombinase
MNEYVIAKYLRLSQDDAVSESMSIPHQRLMLNEFVDELPIPNATILEFVDNGFTGTNLNRPAAQGMLDLVRCGKVNCIIVKDFSRFSRDSMESGYYIEQVFPLYGVRFISVADHYDSNDYDGGTGGLDVAFKFIMHEYYSKDLSMKVKSAKHILMKNGEHIVGGAIYGYRKNDSGKWEYDPTAAEVVREIFDMALDGKTTAEIRDKLFADQRLAPREYEYFNKGKDITPKYNWATRQIFRILTNEQYTGAYIAGKRETSRVGSKKMIEKDRAEWIVLPNKHPPIVSKEEFDKVGEILKAPKEALSHGRERSAHAKKLYNGIESGDRKPNATLYGYRVSPCGTAYEIDEPAAQAVRMVFDLALQGYTARDIGEELFKAKHIPPGEYFKLAKGANIEPKYRWPNLRVREILKNEQYTGAYVAGRTFQDDSGRKYHTPKSEWIIILDKRPAIVSKEVYEQVQALASQGKRRMQPHNYLLKGKIVCGTCGHAMIYGITTYEPMYRCMSTHADPTAACHKLKLCAAEVADAVMTVLKVQAGLVLESDDLSGLRKSVDSGQFAEYEKQIKALAEQRQTVYEQFITGEIDRETYRSIKSDLTAQLDKLKNMVAAIRQSEIDSQSMKNTADQAKAVLGDALTPREIVDALIEKVHVFPNDHIEISWKVFGFAVV